MLLWYAIAVGTGLFLGLLFYFLVRIVVPKGLTGRYWSGVAHNVQMLLTGDERKFWSYYRSIIRETFRYVGLQITGLFCGIAPIVILMIFIWPRVEILWNKDTTLVAFPNNAGDIVLEGGRNGSNPTPINAEDKADRNARHVMVLKNGHRLNLQSILGKFVLYSKGSVSGNLLVLLGFSGKTVDPSHLEKHSIVIVRADNNDWNPFWPYLSDMEFLFFLCFSLMSLGLMVGRKDRKKPEPTEGYSIDPIDALLTWIATRYAGAMRLFGNVESTIFRRRIDSINVEKPIFVTGLARAGTTILLETLSRVDDVTSHRYKDFPFIMTPVFWNRFISFFAKEQAPVDRPHKDRIRITPDSPEAFEEPIWKYFFPFLHDSSALHILDSDAVNSSFEKFYVEHIKKILMIRKGSRYLSKGNYNITRIEYIGKIFKDAKFLIPIRHPFHHIQSLVRQHRIFMDYSKDDSQVKEYLKAVGHYEFGPQREPICLNHEECGHILQAWKAGDDHTGYALQWAHIYRFVAYLLSKQETIADRILVVRFEDLCHDPFGVMEKIWNFVEIENSDALMKASKRIKPPSHTLNLSEKQIESCWEAFSDVASLFGYQKELSETAPFNQRNLMNK